MINIRYIDQKSPIGEAYRTIRTNIILSDIDNEIKTILFTSTKQDEGKSTIVANVAYAFSKLENKKVLLMDLDLRNPSVHKMFSESNTFGIMEYLREEAPLYRCLNKIENNFYILPSGMIPPNPSEVLSSKKMMFFLQSIREHFDYIFIDAPPTTPVSDASIICKYVDGAVYVIEYNEIDISYANVGIDNLKKAEVNIIGAILNKYIDKESVYGYYDYYE